MKLQSVSLFIIVLIQFHQAIGIDLSYGRAQSSSSSGQSAQVFFKLNKQNKLFFSANTAKDTSGQVDDTETGSFKIGYRHKFLEPNIDLTTDIKKTNDSNFYEGYGGSLKLSFGLHEWAYDQDEVLTTRLTMKGDTQSKTYTYDTTENLQIRSWGIGLEQDLFPNFSVGAEYTSKNYYSNGTETKADLTSPATTTTDISSYLSNLSSSTYSGYMELNLDPITIGISLTQDNPYFSSAAKYSSTEVYIDWQVVENASLNVSFSRGKSTDSTTNTDTWNTGLSISF